MIPYIKLSLDHLFLGTSKTYMFASLRYISKSFYPHAISSKPLNQLEDSQWANTLNNAGSWIVYNLFFAVRKAFVNGFSDIGFCFLWMEYEDFAKYCCQIKLATDNTARYTSSWSQSETVISNQLKTTTSSWRPIFRLDSFYRVLNFWHNNSYVSICETPLQSRNSFVVHLSSRWVSAPLNGQ